MKQKKTKFLTKSARKVVVKDIKLRLTNALIEVMGLSYQGSKKVRRIIEKGVKKFAKKISKQIPRPSLKKSDSISAISVKSTPATNLTKDIAKPASNTGAIQKRITAENASSSVATPAKAAKRVKPGLQGV